MLIIIHLSLMSAATLCLISGVAVAMFKRSKNYWFKAHKTLNTTGLIILLAGTVMAIVGVTVGEGGHFSGLHQRIGLVTVILSCVTVFLGYYSIKAKNKTALLALHRWLGRLSVLGVLFVLILGLIMIGII